ncbi:MAG: MATE family efflux transporter [Lachnospiraceae bacterium]|nr:MATE family efflux transporter [Lachnospiraceae bacterium]
MNLDTGKEINLYIKYLLPTICAMVFNAIYIITDTLMIGKGIGEEGLVALNLLLPIFSAYFGIGYLFGVGGSVLLSVAKGKKDADEQKKIFSTTVTIAVITGVLVSLIPFIMQNKLYRILGATDDNIKITREYGSIMFAFGWVYILQTVINCFVRNDEAPRRSMAGTIVGSCTNVVLDYIFIYKCNMGMSGAIIATVIGNALNMLIAASHLLSRNNNLHYGIRSVTPERMKNVIINGASPCFNEVAWGIVVFVFNLQIVKYFGNYGLVIYSIISNTLIVTNSFMNSAGNAMQPLVSYSIGAGNKERVRKFTKIGFAAITIFVIIMYGVICGFTNGLIHLFVKPSEIVVKEGIPAIRIYFLSLFFAMVNVYFSVYFQATLKSAYAMIISLLRGFGVTILFVIMIPLIFGAASVWWVMLVSEGVTMIVTFFLFRRKSAVKA